MEASSSHSRRLRILLKLRVSKEKLVSSFHLATKKVGLEKK